MPKVTELVRLRDPVANRHLTPKPTFCMPSLLGRSPSPPWTAPPWGTQVYLTILASVLGFSRGLHMLLSKPSVPACVFSIISTFGFFINPAPAHPSPATFLFCPYHKLRSRPSPQLWLWKGPIIVDVVTVPYLVEHGADFIAPHRSSRKEAGQELCPFYRQRTESQGLP